MTQIVANRYLQRTTNVSGSPTPAPPLPPPLLLPPGTASVMCAFSRQEGGGGEGDIWCKSCASSTSAVSQISRGAFATHPYNNVWKFFSVLVKNEAPHVSDTEGTPCPRPPSFSLSSTSLFETVCVSLQLSSLVVFNVVFFRAKGSPQGACSVLYFSMKLILTTILATEIATVRWLMIPPSTAREQCQARPNCSSPVPVPVRFYFF